MISEKDKKALEFDAQRSIGMLFERVMEGELLYQPISMVIACIIRNYDKEVHKHQIMTGYKLAQITLDVLQQAINIVKESINEKN